MRRESADLNDTKDYPTQQVAEIVNRLVRLSMTPAGKSKRCKQKITITSDVATRAFCRADARRNYELRSVLADLDRLP